MLVTSRPQMGFPFYVQHPDTECTGLSLQRGYFAPIGVRCKDPVALTTYATHLVPAAAKEVGKGRKLTELRGKICIPSFVRRT